MLYAASKAGLKDALGADIAIQASDENDLSLSEIYEKLVYKILIKCVWLSGYIALWFYSFSIYKLKIIFTIIRLKIHVHLINSYNYFIWSFCLFVGSENP